MTPPRDGALLQVQDEGPGIPAAERDTGLRTLLPRLGRVGAPGGGTGLGLAIARWVVDLHGGQIAVIDSPAGCLIRVVLPQPPLGPS